MSFSSFDSFVGVAKRFPRDTAYLLFYQKQPNESIGEDVEAVAEVAEVKLKTDLKMIVEADNVKFMREKERTASSSANSLTTSSNFNNRKGPPGGAGAGGCGGGSFNTPGRFIC